MKKLTFILALSMIIGTSCSKDRTCTCTNSNSLTTTTSTKTTTLVESTKGQAKANCVSTEYTDATTNITYKTECKLN
ncbi:MAG: hypothetical protein AB7O73_05470 [Bacteroidia bacterium]